jgi:CP family cyanate transporter-like MFS transporter
MAHPTRQESLFALAGLFLAALALRPQLVGIGPLLPEIQDDLAVSHGVAGLLGAIPVLCMGLFAPPAALLAGRLGARNAIALCIALIAAFGLGRALVPSAEGLILLTFGVGAGMGLAGALLPVAVKQRFRDRPAFGTGVYATAIQLGSAVSAAVAVPLAQATIGWRGALIVFSIFTAGLVVAWLLLMPGDPKEDRATAGPPRLPWRSRTAWLLVALFALLSIVYYGFNAWLPASYLERGWEQGSTGNLLAVLNAAALPASLILPFAADRIGSRRRYLAVAAAVLTAAAAGVVLLPDGGWLWVIIFGAAMGTLFPLILTLPLDVADRPAEVGAVAGLMLGAGYSLSAVSPVGLGLVRDATGSFSASLWLVVASGALLFLLTLLVSPDRLRSGISRQAAISP